MKSRIYEIASLNYRIASHFDRYIGTTASKVHVKFQGDRTIVNKNLAASRLCEILQEDVLLNTGMGPDVYGLREDIAVIYFQSHVRRQLSMDFKGRIKLPLSMQIYKFA